MSAFLTDLHCVMNELRKWPAPPDLFSLFSPGMFGGMRVIEAPARIVPRIKLRESVPVGDDFRRDFDTWLLEMFGTRDDSIVPIGTAYIFGGVANYKGAWVPSVVMGGQQAGSNGAQALVDMLTAKTARDLSLDMTQKK